VAAYNTRKLKELMSNAGIIRNRLKIEAAVRNARSFLTVQQEYGSFDKYIWQFVGGRTLKNSWNSVGELPAQTDKSAAMSSDLKKRGFKFVGPTICYAFMQATGMVNDHTVDCYRYKEV
jgi:DNA-3-methyladenine glycosylase I